MNAMTCREMEWLLRDIAAERDAVPHDAMEHLAACPRCLAQLERERRLAANLTALAGSSEASLAPAALQAMETRLRAQFRENRSDRTKSWSVLPLVAGRPAAWGAGIAAILILSLGIVLRDSRLPGTPSASGILAVNPGIAQEPGAEPVERPAAENSLPEAVLPSARGAMNGSPEGDAMPVGTEATAFAHAAEQTAPGQPPQASSDFVPLFYGDPSLMEAGQVWRVQMPRSALQSVGMPVVEESRSGPIQVDILLGEDGIARAIRFVQ